MKKIAFIFYALCLSTSCKLIDNERPGSGLYVRIVNTGSITTQSYIINEPYGPRLRQHFFPGLRPGDSTSYIHFKRLRENEPITLVMDSIAITQLCKDCESNVTTTKGKVTIGIRAYGKDVKGKKANDFQVNYYYGGK